MAGVEVLHDRRVPRTVANIDHIVVGPSGVFVIDAKKNTGRVEARDVGGLFRVDERLYVNGRDRTKLVDGVLSQVDVVRTDQVGVWPRLMCRRRCGRRWSRSVMLAMARATSTWFGSPET